MREGWIYKELGNLCTIKGRIGFRGYTREDLVNEGQGAITLSPSNIIEDKLDLSNCSFISWFKYEESPEIMVFNGDIIYAKTASIGKVAIIDNLPEKATINPQFVVLKEIKCDNRYLYYALRSSFFKEQASSIVRGVAIPTISQANLSLLKIPVPSLQEQKRIVAELDLLTGIIDKQKQQLKELDTLAQSIFYDMFGNPEENTKCWRTEKFQTICTSLFAGGDVPKDNYSETKSETYNVPILSNGVGDKAVYGYTNKARVFDECITISGRGTIGYCEVRSEPFFPVVRLIVAVPNKDILLPIVLKYIVDSLHLHGVGVAIPQLTIPMVKNVSIILPSMEMQCLFAKIIQSIESQKQSINRSIAECQKLFDYTMDKYFG